jgi:hypothetical protein
MTQRRSSIPALIPVLAVLAACPRQETGRDSGPGTETAADSGQFTCGTPEGIDDMPEFVGSCMGSSGDRGCTEVTTRPKRARERHGLLARSLHRRG